MQNPSANLDKLRALMALDGIEVCVISDIANIMWLTGFEHVFDDEPAHRVIVSQKQAALLSDSRYEDALRRAAVDTPWFIDTHRGAMSARGVAMIEEWGLSSFAVEDSMTLGEFRQWEHQCQKHELSQDIRELSHYVLWLRSEKTSEEIKALQAAQRITDDAFAYIVSFLRRVYREEERKLTEREVQIELDQAMRVRGADDLAFATIMASGAQGAAPHSIPGDKIIEPGDMVVMDFGAKLNGYHSDMTRMVCIGEPSKKARHAFETLRRANEEVEALLAPGYIASDAHNHAEKVLEEEGFGGCMGHSLGHGVGLEIHELPTLSPRNDKPLEVGNVVTVEPGIYIPGEFGCRLEDCGVVTENGFKVFTQSTHELVII